MQELAWQQEAGMQSESFVHSFTSGELSCWFGEEHPITMKSRARTMIFFIKKIRDIRSI